MAEKDFEMCETIGIFMCLQSHKLLGPYINASIKELQIKPETAESVNYGHNI